MDYSIQPLRFTETAKLSLRTSSCFGILLIFHGTLTVHTGARALCCSMENLLISKPGEVLALEYEGGRYPLDGYWVKVSPSLLQQLSSPQTNLEAGFLVSPLPIAVLRVRNENLMLIKSIASRMAVLSEDPEPYGIDILETGMLQMFLVLTLRACIAQDPYRPNKKESLMLDHVFRYIHAHLTEDITLETLEKEFFVSKNHLCREFKRQTGQTIHRYIVKSRLDLCREYIEQGYSVTEVYRMGGFGGYNHFFRAFKQEYQMTPMQYYRHIQQSRDQAALELSSLVKPYRQPD